LGTILSMQIPFVGFQPVQSSEHMLVKLNKKKHLKMNKNGVCFFFRLQAFGTFGLCQLFSFIEYVKSKLTQAQFDTLFSFALVTVGFGLGIASLVLWASGSKIDISSEIVRFRLTIIFCKKSHHGPEDFTLYWIHPTPKIIFQSLLVLVNINRQLGQVSFSILNYLFLCFQVNDFCLFIYLFVCIYFFIF